MDETEKIVYTVTEVAQILHLNKAYVYRLINKGYLKALKFTSLRVTRKSLDKFLEEYEDVDLSNV